MVIIIKGYELIIDDSDYGIIEGMPIYIFQRKDSDTVYAITRGNVRVHRKLLGITDPNIMIDHINGNGLDNRRCNLRVCTQKNNSRNRSKSDGKTSIYKGVYLYRGAWVSGIRVNNKRIYLGAYDKEAEAAIAYNDAAVKHFGEFAKLNTIQLSI